MSRLAHRFAIPLSVFLLVSVLAVAAQPKASLVPKKTSTNTYATARVTADLNGDGIPDLIESYARITVGKLFSVQLGLGNGYFAAPVDYTASINHQYGDTVLTADVNHDGKADVIFITGKVLLVYLGRGDGTLVPAQQYAFDNFVLYADVGDFNHDGFPDLVAALPDKVIVEWGTGTGSFSAPITIATIGSSQGIETLAVGDFDGDANLDVAVGVYNTPCDMGGCASDDIHILYGNGANSFADNLVYPGVAGDLSFSSGDLNNDGRSDLLVQLIRATKNNVYLLALLGQTSRSVAAHYLDTGGHNLVRPPQVIADINGDGYNDLAVQLYGLPGAPNNLALGLLLGSADNTFKLQEIDYGAFPPPDGGNLLIGDFNRDREPDVLFTASDNSDSVFNVFDYVNTGGIGVRTRCEYPIATAAITSCLYRSGANGSTIAFGAAANWFEPLRKMELWLDGKKTAEQYNVWDRHAWLQSNPRTLAHGNHRADIYSAGYDNSLQHQTVTFTVPGPSCPPPGSPGVHVCSPLNGSTVGRSVEVLAGGNISGTIARMEVWVGGAKMYSTFGSNQIDATLTIAPGQQTITFFVVNTAGDVLSQVANVMVK